MPLSTLLIIILFLVGLYFYIKTSDGSYVEGLTNESSNNDSTSLGQRCPNLLIKKGSSYYLYNSKLTEVPGVNPIQFENLEEYVEFLDWQKSQGIRCPVLYLQQSFNAQGEPCYTARPGVTEPQGGLPPCKGKNPNPTLLIDAARNDPPYNINSYPGYDQNNQYVGSTTPLDAMKINKTDAMANAMTSSWKGVNYTKKKVKSGIYKDDVVGMKN
jgi:hypothetical protein